MQDILYRNFHDWKAIEITASCIKNHIPSQESFFLSHVLTLFVSPKYFLIAFYLDERDPIFLSTVILMSLRSYIIKKIIAWMIPTAY